MSDKPFGPPVVLFAFNRPVVTSRTVERLLSLDPERLFLVADGPRSGEPDDVELCAKVREILLSQPWSGVVETKFSDRNLGLEANIELGLDWVFSQVDRAIVLEDDCVPDPSFFRYCAELLERYSQDPRVWQIAGDSKELPRSLFGDRSYAFTTWASVWGWATWADRWHSHREVFPRDHSGAEERDGSIPRTAAAQRPVEVLPDPDAVVVPAALRHFTQVARETNGDVRGWDHHWWVTIMARRGLSITPAVNLIENDGFGVGATHTRSYKRPVPSEPMSFPLVHPAQVTLDRDVEAELELHLLRIDGRLSRWVRRLVRPLWLRGIVRRAITFPPVWWVVRKIVGR